MKEFQKYKTRGAYHWEQISNHLLKRNAFVLGRYNNMILLSQSELTNLKNKKILDVGCGDGVLSYMLYQRGGLLQVLITQRKQ